MFFSQLPVGVRTEQTKSFRDFAHFYVLGQIASEHRVDDLYDVAAQQRRVAAFEPDHEKLVFPPSYGPQVALFFAPFARLPFVPALVLWLTTTMALYGAALWAMWRAAPGLREWKWPLFMAASSAPAFHFLLMYGQTSALATLFFVAAYLCFRRGDDFLAGLAIGCLFYKPQLGVVAGIVLVAAGQWRAVAGALVAVGAQLFAAGLYWGFGVLPLYANALLNIPATLSLIEPEKQHLHSWRAFFQILRLSPAAVNWATLGASVATIVVAIRAWRSHGDLRPRFVVLGVATILVSPHLYVYDLVVLTPALLLIAELSVTPSLSRRQRRWLVFFAIAGVAVPLTEFIAIPTRIQWTVLVHAALLAFAARLTKLSKA